MTIPDGDILIHAGDFTRYGKRADADDFNAWLATLPHKHKIVVNGNHEYLAPWKSERKTVISHATYLSQQKIDLLVSNASPANDTAPAVHDAASATTGSAIAADIANAADTVNFKDTANATRVSAAKTVVKVFGCQYNARAKYTQAIPVGTDIVVTHVPAKGLVDGGFGCPETRKILMKLKPRLVVCGHIHMAHGVVERDGVVFVNAAICNNDRSAVEYDPVVVDI